MERVEVSFKARSATVRFDPERTGASKLIGAFPKGSRFKASLRELAAEWRGAFKARVSAEYAVKGDGGVVRVSFSFSAEVPKGLAIEVDGPNGADVERTPATRALQVVGKSSPRLDPGDHRAKVRLFVGDDQVGTIAVPIYVP